MTASARRPSISARYLITEPPRAMGHPAVSSRDNDAHRATDRKQLTLSPEWSETAASALQKRTPRTDRLCQNDQARRISRCVRENYAENASLLSCSHAPQDSQLCACVSAISGPASCGVAASTFGMVTAQRINQARSAAKAHGPVRHRSCSLAARGTQAPRKWSILNVTASETPEMNPVALLTRLI